MRALAPRPGFSVARRGTEARRPRAAESAPADFCHSEHHQELLEHALQRAQGVLDRIAAEADPRLASVDHELEPIAGRPAEIIASVAEARGADSIVIGTRGFGRVGDAPTGADRAESRAGQS